MSNSLRPSARSRNGTRTPETPSSATTSSILNPRRSRLGCLMGDGLLRRRDAGVQDGFHGTVSKSRSGYCPHDVLSVWRCQPLPGQHFRCGLKCPYGPIPQRTLCRSKSERPRIFVFDFPTHRVTKEKLIRILVNNAAGMCSPEVYTKSRPMIRRLLPISPRRAGERADRPSRCVQYATDLKSRA